MAIEDETRKVMEGYFGAWTTNRTGDAYALLTPDLEFSGRKPSRIQTYETLFDPTELRKLFAQTSHDR
jgi:hypothetical protein